MHYYINRTIKSCLTSSDRHFKTGDNFYLGFFQDHKDFITNLIVTIESLVFENDTFIAENELQRPKNSIAWDKHRSGDNEQLYWMYVDQMIVREELNRV